MTMDQYATVDGAKRFRNYGGLIRVARSGFPWEKTTKGDVASVYTNCESANAFFREVSPKLP